MALSPRQVPPVPSSLPPPPQPPVAGHALLDWLRGFPGLLTEPTCVPGRGARYVEGFPGIGGGVILVDHSLSGPALTCAVAEEAGHYMTFLNSALPPRTEILREEGAALRWAISLLIPRGGVLPGDTPEDVAARWWVTTDFARRAMAVLAAQGAMWPSRLFR